MNTHAPFPAPAAAHGAFAVMGDGVHIHYRDWGQGDPVLFLAGWALPSEVWAYQMAALSGRGFRCVAYDRRGHGRSSDPGAGYDYDNLADDLTEFLELLDLEKVTVVGHSMACGEIVRHLSRCGSARVARAVFVGASLPCLGLRRDNPEGLAREAFDWFREEILMADYPGWLEANARPFVTPNTSEAMVRWVRGLMEGCSLKAAVECNRSLTEADFRSELAAIDTEVLLIHGDADVSAPLATTGARTAALLPNARLAVYEGAPHGLMLTHARRLNADLEAFIRA